jgi:hypothetical protein
MANIQTSLTKAVLLKPGESFTLPPGATLVAASDEAAIESTCDIPDLEELTCYVYHIVVGKEGGGGDTLFWDKDSFRIKGWSFNNTDYFLPEPLDASFSGSGCYVTHVLGHTIDTVSAPLKQHANDSGIYIDAIVADSLQSDGDGDNGCNTFIVIRTIPSVASKLTLMIGPGAIFTTNVSDQVVAYVKAKTYADMAGNAGVPACPTVSSGTVTTGSTTTTTSGSTTTTTTVAA